MSFAAVLDYDADRRVTKYQEFGSLADAQAHVAANVAQYPKAFAANIPGPGWFSWKVNPSGKALQVDPRTPPAPKETGARLAIKRIADEFGPATKAEILALLDS